MFGKNHIAAAVISAAMVFSMMPLGAIAAEPAGTEVNAQEAGIADAGEYVNAGERVEYLSAGERGEHHSTGERMSGSAAYDTEAKSDAGSGENGQGAEDAYGAAAGSDNENSGETGAGHDSAGAGSGAAGAGGSGAAGSGGSGAADAGGSGAAGAGGSGASRGEGADGGASGSGAASGAGETGEAGSTAADMGGASGESSEAATDQAASAAAGTDAADAVETSLISIHGIVGREFVQYGEIDSESLAGQYFDREVRGTDADAEGGPGSGAALKGVDKVIYDALRKAVEEIAAGLRDSGVVRIPISSGAAGFKSRYTAADLGLEYVYSGSLNPDLMEALEKALPVHYDEIMDCLIADSTCAMFPFTGGVEKPACGTLPFYASGSGDDLDVFWDDYVEIALKPAEEFADPDSGRYAIDAARIKVARGTAGAAKKIVKSASHIVNRSGFIPTTK